VAEIQTFKGRIPLEEVSMITWILLSLLAIVAVLAIVIATRPSAYTVTRSATLTAPAPVVFSAVNDFRNWEAWSPWAKRDPDMETTYSGPESGTGAEYAWKGNTDVGSGRMTIRDSRPNEHIAIELEFKEPFASVSDTSFRFTTVPDGTEVTWSMSGTNGFAAKAFSLFMNVEKMIGKDFEQGLAQMAVVVKAMEANLESPGSNDRMQP
jgi:hypothetical protein